MVNLNSSSIKGITSSKIAKKENNDCFVRALAAATEQDYDTTHEVVRTKFKREAKKGVDNTSIVSRMLIAEDKGLKVGNTRYSVNILGTDRITNTYKLHGEYIKRKKTVKSFIKDNPKGNYIVTVSKHAFALIDGKLVDNKGEEFRPTRKVDGAYKIVKPNLYGKQLQLWG